MKRTILLLCLVVSTVIHAQKFNSHFFRGKPIYTASHPGNTKLLIFLHGGVDNPIFRGETIRPLLLLEENTSFAKTALKNGFDLLMPVTNDSLNWLIYPEYCFTFLKHYIQSLPETYEGIYISGFSDGGTGSYKLFYSHPEYFAGLAVLNGYPQHQNAYLNTDYTAITNKPVIFFSTEDDDVIPYEFLLTEYVKQKKSNPQTYLYIIPGSHSLGSYVEADLQLLVKLLNGQGGNTKKEALHAFMQNDTVVQFYPYRKMVVRKFGYGEDFYMENKAQQK